MQLKDLFHGYETVEIHGDSSIDIRSIVYDSRKVTPGSLFIAIRGFTADGNSFVSEAIRKGAVAVLTENPTSLSNAVVVNVYDVRKAMAHIADGFYGSPQKALIMIGITGTNGKTTTSHMVKSIFDTCGMNCGLIGTIHHIVAGKTIKSVNTTPESVDIHSFLARMVEARQNACVMEVSSHALALSRVNGIDFRVAAFLNLSRDHLDFHVELKNYLDAKCMLFSNLSGDSTAVINRDDPHADHIIALSRRSHILTFGTMESSDIHPLSMKLETNKTAVVLKTPMSEMAFTFSIPGRFNVLNAMAATGIGLACGFPKDIIIRGLESIKPVKGRFEIVDEGQDFTVIVDYAHTPDALERMLTSAREITRKRVISVFGCGGDRDRGKRPLMGETSSRLADLTVITSDNPRTEDPHDIISDILKGITLKEKCEIISDREEAIKKALEIAHPGDTVVIAGKGHEDYQIIGNKKHNFDDTEITRLLLKAMR